MNVRLSIATGCVVLLAASAGAQAIRTNTGFAKNVLPRNDDDSAPLTPLGFRINFFGKTRESAYVNNNGNITFDTALATYTPFGLQKTSREIIAPFFADVDTRGLQSKLVTYGQDTVSGHLAFAANYLDVGYFSAHDDKLNRFQVVIIDRSDTGPGNFNIEFNYERIVWETGDASGGVGGFGGVPVVLGWSNGTPDDGTSFQLEGSMVSGAFLDSGPKALVRAHLNTSQVGRLLFQARDGVISPGMSIRGGLTMPDATLGQPYSYLFTTAGVDSAVTWSLIPDLTMPAGISFSNGILSGQPGAPGTYTFTVSASATVEGEAVTVFKRGSLTVGIPQITINAACPLPSGTVGQLYSKSFSSPGSTGPIAWSVESVSSLPPGIALSGSGLLGGVPLVPGSYLFNLRARSADGSGMQSAQKSCQLNIVPASLRLASGCALKDATTGVPYLSVLTADGGVGPYRFDLIGQLPLGLSMSQDGQVSGLALVAGYYPFRVTATDTRGNVISESCTLSSSAPAFNIASACPLPNGLTGSAYSTLLTAQGGSPPYTWSVSGALPPGLALSPDGGIDGTPMTAGPYRFRLIAADVTGNQAGAGCSLSVTRGPLGIVSCPFPEATVGDIFSLRLNPAGGAGPYLWSVSGPLPPGLDLSIFGIVDGTLTTPGNFLFSLGLRDGNQQFITQPCSMKVKPVALSLATTCPAPPASIGRPYAAAFTAAGGTPPYRFDFSGYLPGGLYGSSDGSLSGTPSVVGPASFAVQVTDAAGAAAQWPCSVEVGLPPVPKMSIAAPPSVAPATTGFKLGVELARPYTLPITGQINMTVSPDTRSPEANANQPDPHLRFMNGQLNANFMIPAGSTRVDFPLLSTGTVASTITVSVGGLRAAGADVSLPVLPRLFSVLASPPVIASACFTKSGSGIVIAVLGSSTTRDLVSGQVSAGSTSRVIALSDVASSYFQDDGSIRFGGAFTLQFAADAIFAQSAGPFTVQLSNTVGWSSSVTAPRCQ